MLINKCYRLLLLEDRVRTIDDMRSFIKYAGYDVNYFTGTSLRDWRNKTCSELWELINDTQKYKEPYGIVHEMREKNRQTRDRFGNFAPMPDGYPLHLHLYHFEYKKMMRRRALISSMMRLN